MTSPGCSLTGTLTDTGGNSTTGATVTMLLVNYGYTTPFVGGSNVFAQPMVSAVANSSGQFTLSFFGNYQISPSGSVYQISIQLPGPSGFNTSTMLASYVFLTAGSFDLSTLIPVITPPSSPLALMTKYAEVPSGTINGTNPTFTLVNVPIPSASLSIYVNGIRQLLNTSYTLSGNTITFQSGYIPHTGASVVATYTYL